MGKNDLSSLVSRIERLEAKVFAEEVESGKKSKKTITKEKNLELDFSLNIRAFVRKFVVHRSGPERFALLLAYLVKGELEKGIARSEIGKEWNKMTAKNLLGNKFNGFYASEAKTRGWVDSPEHGIYSLANNWKESYK